MVISLEFSFDTINCMHSQFIGTLFIFLLFQRKSSFFGSTQVNLIHSTYLDA